MFYNVYKLQYKRLTAISHKYISQPLCFLHQNGSEICEWCAVCPSARPKSWGTAVCRFFVWSHWCINRSENSICTDFSCQLAGLFPPLRRSSLPFWWFSLIMKEARAEKLWLLSRRSFKKWRTIGKFLCFEVRNAVNAKWNAIRLRLEKQARQYLKLQTGLAFDGPSMMILRIQIWSGCSFRTNTKVFVCTLNLIIRTSIANWPSPALRWRFFGKNTAAFIRWEEIRALRRYGAG